MPNSPGQNPGQNKAKGRRKEDLVARYLRKKGWTILHRNKKIFGVETDIFAEKQGERILVEVKSVKKDAYLERILKARQKERLKRVASALSDSSSSGTRLFLAGVSEKNTVRFFEIS